MKPDFSGIDAKLVRANENIGNLNREINAFFDSSQYPFWRHDDKDTALKAMAYHRKRVIPLRFSILAGEILHHLRSVLDHVVWQFSSDWYRLTKPTQIEFPVLEVRPPDKPGRTGYERHVKGISDPAALILIEVLQPYYSSKPVRHPLAVLHKFNIADKHRHALLCVSTGAIPISDEMYDRFVRHHRGEPGSAPVDFAAEFKRDPKVIPQISFKDFGGREIEPVIQGLAVLHNFVIKVCERFSVLSEYVYPVYYE
jgi:hypothetical protein